MEKFKKPMLIVCGGFIILIFFMFMLSSCKKNTYTSEEFVNFLIDRVKSYYKNNLPQTDGTSTSINISNVVDNQEKYLTDNNVCSGTINITNNNGYYLYTPNINCSDGYSTTKLTTFLTRPDKLVTSSHGLYQINDYYIYRGENIDNYVVFNNQLWRIIKINSDGSIRMIETNYSAEIKDGKIQQKSNKRTSVPWDDRYNSEKNYSVGFNDFIHDGINSRIKDTLDNIYKEDFTEKTKGYILKQNLCVGRRSKTDTINDGSIECSEIISDQYIGLLQVNEFINASLDPQCISIDSVTCSNYNYMTEFGTNFWSITTVQENSYEVYKIGINITDSSANSYAVPKIVINISGEVTFNKGDGTIDNPFIIE